MLKPHWPGSNEEAEQHASNPLAWNITTTVVNVTATFPMATVFDD